MKNDAGMATRSPQMSGRKPGEASTQFQLHKSQLSVNGNRRTLFDYTEFRLKMYIEQIKDEEQQKTLQKILRDYKQGLVAVAWKSGKPVWFNVTKESSKH